MSVDGDSRQYKSIDSLSMIKANRFTLGLVGGFAALCSDPEVRNEIRMKIGKARSEVDEIISIIDKFYDLLGKKNWVCFDSLFMDRERIERMISGVSSDEAERELISYLQEEKTLERMLVRLNYFPDMQSRLGLLQKAKNDYLEGRYYSSVLVVVTVMEGFVDDALIEEGRKGLSTRESNEMWVEHPSCLAAIGLPVVHNVLVKPIRKRIDEPCYDVHRHGLMHGKITNFDNDIVASKAWCILFAVCDYVRAKKEVSEQSKEKIGIKQLFKKSLELCARKTQKEDISLTDRWSPHSVDFNDPAKEDEELINSCNEFFSAWCNENYGKVSSFFLKYDERTQKARAGEANRHYSQHPIDEFEIEEIERTAPAKASIKVQLRSEKKNWTALTNWVRLDDSNSPVADFNPGEWRILRHLVDPFQNIDNSF